MVCIIRGEPSAVPKRWVGAIVPAGAGRAAPPAWGPVLGQVIERAWPQVSSLVICTTLDRSPLAHHGLAVVTPDRPGLLAAVLAGLEWTAAHSRETAWIATFAGDAPDFPDDLVERLGHAVGAEGADMAWAAGDRTAPAFGLWPVRLRRSLRKSLDGQPDLAVGAWAARFRVAAVFLDRPFQKPA